MLDTLNSLPDPDAIELISVVGYLGDQIEQYINEHYPKIKGQYVVQENPRGQSHAIYLAREYLHGPMLVVFADTLIKTDLKAAIDTAADAVVWGKTGTRSEAVWGG